MDAGKGPRSIVSVSAASTRWAIADRSTSSNRASFLIRHTATPPITQIGRLFCLSFSLADREVGLRVLAGQGAAIDTATASGRLVFGMFAALAEFERDLIRERTRAGLAAAKARGRKGGRKFALTKTQVRLALAAMKSRDTSVTDLAMERGIKPVTLYRYVGPDGDLREHGRQVLQS